MKENTIDNLILDYRQWSDILDCISAAIELRLQGQKVLSLPCTNSEEIEILEEYYAFVSDALNNTEMQ